MSLVQAVVVFVVGYVSGAITGLFAGIAALVALVLAILGLATPAAIFSVIDPVLSFYAGNELLFLSGFLFAIDNHRNGSGRED